MTKHETLLQYIINLPIGSKISVRRMAKVSSVSEGTAYRAIKDAEIKGYVTTIPKMGTLRIKKPKGGSSKQVTFAELIKVVNGIVLGGKEGLYKSLDKFVIGAMELEEMATYIREGCILIVGNREEAHELALQKGAAVLISGGFDTCERNKSLADKYALPIIQSPYDTYRIASLINNALHNKTLEQEILHAGDIINESVYYLCDGDTIEDWQKLLDETRHSRFPVVDNQKKVIGVVTAKDVAGERYTTPIKTVMTQKPITVSPETLIVSVAHIMVWEGIELIPVVRDNHLIGVVTRQDVMEALQFGKKWSKSGAIYKTLVKNNFTEERSNGEVVLKGDVTPEMTDQVGSMDPSVLITLITMASYTALGHDHDFNIVLENCYFYYLGPIQLGQYILVHARTLEMSRRHGKVDIEIKHRGKVLLKAFVSCQLLER